MGLLLLGLALVTVAVWAASLALLLVGVVALVSRPLLRLLRLLRPVRCGAAPGRPAPAARR